MLKNKIKVSVIGATGIVGQNYLSLLDNHPWFSVVDVAASKNNSGKIFSNAVNGKWALKENIPTSVRDLVVRDVFDFKSLPDGVRCVFSAVDLPSKGDTKKLEFDYAKKGYALISNNSANRFTNDVPMIIPEINPNHTDVIRIQQKKRSLPEGGFVAVKPNCSIQSYIFVIDALIKAGYIPKQISVTTLQALSGAGKAGLENENLRENVVPYIPGEEEKTENEPLKIFGTVSKVGINNFKDINISAVCTRVPVIDGHTAVVYLNFLKGSLSVKDFKSLLSSYNDTNQLLELPSSPKRIIRILDGVDRPQPKLDCETGNGMETIVGRIEKDKIFDMRFIGLSHNTVRGAAGGAILMAELLVKKIYIWLINQLKFKLQLQ